MPAESVQSSGETAPHLYVLEGSRIRMALHRPRRHWQRRQDLGRPVRRDLGRATQLLLAGEWLA